MAEASTVAAPKARTAKPWIDSPVTSHHHLSFRCADPEATRKYYEDFLGLEFTAARRITAEVGGESVEALELMFRMKDGDFVTFYHIKDKSFDLPELGPLDRHLAFKLPSEQDWDTWIQRMKDAGEEFQGPLDHDFVRSIYWCDPNGVWLEFAYEVDRHDEMVEELERHAREGMDNWTVMTAKTKTKGTAP